MTKCVMKMKERKEEDNKQLPRKKICGFYQLRDIGFNGGLRS